MNEQPSWWELLKGKTMTSSDDNDDDNLMHTWKGNCTGVGVPTYGWRIALSHKFNDHPVALSIPPLLQIPAFIGLGVRYLQYYKQLYHKNKRPCMDVFNQIALNQIYGVPLGGIGGGTINRGWQGDFCKWQLKPGVYTHDCPLADQFIVSVQRNNRTVFQQVLSTKSPSGEPLRSWNWKYCGSYAYYHGLYPRAWTVYDIQGQGIVLTCRQISPVFPHDYKDTSIPSAVFVWSIENNRDDDAVVTIAMSMENGTGNPKELKTTSGSWNETFVSNKHEKPVKGVVMHNNTYPYMPYTLTVAATEKTDQSISTCTSFNPKKDGSEVWAPLLSMGRLTSQSEKSHSTSKSERIACAVAATCRVKGNSSNEVDFCLAWDMPQLILVSGHVTEKSRTFLPEVTFEWLFKQADRFIDIDKNIIHFGDRTKYYKRRYTRWFGSNGDAGPAIADYSLHNYPVWEKKIDEWQSPILNNGDIPAWYKSALFNELYYVTDGGTVWLENESCDVDRICNNNTILSNNDEDCSAANVANDINTSREEEIRNCSHIKEYGRFAYLEGQEYKMYNTYDVHFYASIALIHLWPMLEISLQYDIAASVVHSNTEKRKYLMDGAWAPVKTPNCVPHDVGCPDDDPWLQVNTYFVHDTADWRDLNPKFVLQAFRDYHVTQDKEFLKTMWPICTIVMDHGIKHDQDGDGLIENSGSADQTFDGWFVSGPSAYCGGLWLAALRFMTEAAEVLGYEAEKAKYGDLLKNATAAYDKHLWNGKYYNYDSSRNSGRDSVMADQCAGQWYLSAAGITDVLPEEKILSALQTVFDLNVQMYDDGRHGAVNGMRPDGKVDTCSVQSVEVWTGVTYSLAATMIHKGMFKEGFRTASGIYRTCWHRYGMSYQTPEAFRKNRTYRSLAYMRPLSIWGMQYAIENHNHKPKEKVAISTDKC